MLIINHHSMNINRVTLLGNIVKDVTTSTTKTNKNVSRFTVATNFAKSVEYHTCIAWDKLSEIATQYLKKGDRVYVEGRLHTNSWEGKDKKKQYTTEVVANHLIMLGRGSGAARPEDDEMTEGEGGSDVTQKQ